MAEDNKDPKMPPKPPPLPSSAGGTPPPPPLPPGLSKGLGGLAGFLGATPSLPPGRPASQPPSPAGMPSLPPSLSGGMKPPSLRGPMPALPGVPSQFPGSQRGSFPGLSGPPAAPAQPPRPEGPSPEQVEYERKVAELEKRLSDEHEKLLLANLKSQQEAATSARVEVSIRELQDKLRRDRREAEAEESRRVQETKVQELEARLAQERETWVTTLKNQMQAREGQEKEVESHFAMRLQEMERRWLEEKAGWQKSVLAKDEEIRNLRNLAEKLKGADGELSKTAAEKKQLEARLTELVQERAEAAAKLSSAAEREKEAVQLRADLTVSRQQYTMLQERLERDLQAARASSRDREERLMADQERLQRDLASVGERLRAEHEADLRRLKLEAGNETSRYKEAAERSAAELNRLRAICGALERQHAAGRAQLDELKRASAEWEKNQERYKAEFVVLQRKWVDREKEIRSEASAQALQMLEAEKGRIKVQAQDEINQRAARMAEQMEKEKAIELRQREATLRIDIERETMARVRESERAWEKTRLDLSSEIDRLRAEMTRKDTEWSQKLLNKETELVNARGQATDLTNRLERAEEARREAAGRGLELDKAVQAAREDIGALRQELADIQGRLAKEEKWRQTLQTEKTDLERLSTAQGAQVKSVEETLERLRAELSREGHLGRLALADKEKSVAAQRAAEQAQAGAEAARQQTEAARRQAEEAKTAADASRQLAEEARARLELEVARQREEMAKLSEDLEARVRRCGELEQKLAEEQNRTVISRLFKGKTEE